MADDRAGHASQDSLQGRVSRVEALRLHAEDTRTPGNKWGLGIATALAGLLGAGGGTVGGSAAGAALGAKVGGALGATALAWTGPVGIVVGGSVGALIGAGVGAALGGLAASYASWKLADYCFWNPQKQHLDDALESLEGRNQGFVAQQKKDLRNLTDEQWRELLHVPASGSKNRWLRSKLGQVKGRDNRQLIRAALVHQIADGQSFEQAKASKADMIARYHSSLEDKARPFKFAGEMAFSSADRADLARKLGIDTERAKALDHAIDAFAKDHPYEPNLEGLVEDLLRRETGQRTDEPDAKDDAKLEAEPETAQDAAHGARQVATEQVAPHAPVTAAGGVVEEEDGDAAGGGLGALPGNLPGANDNQIDAKTELDDVEADRDQGALYPGDRNVEVNARFSLQERQALRDKLGLQLGDLPDDIHGKIDTLLAKAAKDADLEKEVGGLLAFEAAKHAVENPRGYEVDERTACALVAHEARYANDVKNVFPMYDAPLAWPRSAIVHRYARPYLNEALAGPQQEICDKGPVNLAAAKGDEADLERRRQNAIAHLETTMNAIVVKTQVPENLRRLLRALGDTAAKHANPEAQGREDFDRAFVRNIFVRDLIEARLTNKLDATDEQRADLGYISTLVDRAFSPAPEHEQPFESPNQNLAQIHAHVKYAVQGWRDFASEWIDSLSGRKAWQQRR